MSRFVIIFNFLCLSLAACRAAPSAVVANSTRIIGGNPTTIQRYPFAVQVNQNNQLICGGTLVSRRCVLSAAHCFVSRDNHVPNPSLYSARVGSALLNSGGSVHRVNRIVVHEQYNLATSEHDVAVMVLRANVTLGPTVQVARIAPQGLYIPDNATLIHIGWGRTQPNSNSLSPILNEVAVRKVNHRTCAAQYRLIGLTVTNNMICAGLLGIGGADACQGDSGGPLVGGAGAVVGVTSWGRGCGDAFFPGVSARLANYSTWVNTQITRYNASPALSALNALVLVASLAVSVILK